MSTNGGMRRAASFWRHLPRPPAVHVLLRRSARRGVRRGLFEPGLPSWHGIWWLMSPGGSPLPWAGTLTTTRIGRKTVLASADLTVLGWVNFPLYTFSADKPGKAVCSA